MNKPITPPAPTKSRSPEHAGATLAQLLRKKRIALKAAEQRAQGLYGDIELLKKTAPADVLAIALRILGEPA